MIDLNFTLKIVVLFELGTLRERHWHALVVGQLAFSAVQEVLNLRQGTGLLVAVGGHLDVVLN